MRRLAVDMLTKAARTPWECNSHDVRELALELIKAVNRIELLEDRSYQQTLDTIEQSDAMSSEICKMAITLEKSPENI